MHLERQSMDNSSNDQTEWQLQDNDWLAMELCPNLA